MNYNGKVGEWEVYILSSEAVNSLYLSISCFTLAVCRCHHHPPLKLHCPFLPHYSSNPPIFSILIQRFQLPIPTSTSALLPSASNNIIMGLSPYSNPSDAGLLCVILVKTAMSISFMKEILRSILHVVGIRFPSSEDFSDQSFTESPECRGTPSTTYMEEFRSRTPTLRYDSVSCLTKQECSVCLIEFKPEAAINRLSCGHVFHKSCLEKWLKYWNVTCPLCRNHMMAPLETEENTCPM